MLMYYKLVKRKNPRNESAPAKYYAQAVTMSTVTEKQLAEQIAATCTVKYPDVLCVLIALQEEIITCLREGYTIQLGTIGNLYGTLNGAGAATEDAWNLSYIAKYRVRFSPSTATEIDVRKDKDFSLEKLTIKVE